MLTKEQYNKFCKDAENMEIYDGRGTYNLYECQKSTCDSKGRLFIEKGCGHCLLTTYRDKGVTPFIIPCSECGGELHHTKSFSVVPDSVKALAQSWVRPSYEHYKRLSKATQNHIEKGGLVLKSELIGLIPH